MKNSWARHSLTHLGRLVRLRVICSSCGLGQAARSTWVVARWEVERGRNPKFGEQKEPSSALFWSSRCHGGGGLLLGRLSDEPRSGKKVSRMSSGRYMAACRLPAAVGGGGMDAVRFTASKLSYLRVDCEARNRSAQYLATYHRNCDVTVLMMAPFSFDDSPIEQLQ